MVVSFTKQRVGIQVKHTEQSTTLMSNDLVLGPVALALNFIESLSTP